MKLIEYEVEFTKQARKDFFNLHAFQARQPSIPFEKVKIAIESLVLLPERYPFFEEKPWIEKEIRVIEKDGVCIFYFIKKDEKKVYVVRIFYARKFLVEQVKSV